MKKIVILILVVCFISFAVPTTLSQDILADSNDDSQILNMCSILEFISYLDNANVNSNSAEEYDICVLLELNDPMSKNSSSFDTSNILSEAEDINESLRSHREKVKAYYSEKNEEAASKLKLDEYSYYASFYSPYIEIVFDDLAEYEHYENDVIESIKNNSGIVLSASNYATIKRKTTEASIENDDCDTIYLLTDAFRDIGVLDSEYERTTTYTGNGVNVGIIDEAVPYTYNLKAGKYTLLTTTQGLHSTVIASIIGGTSGIAENVHFYCTELGDSLINACNTLIDEYNVNIINLSMSIYASGHYVNIDAFVDNIISNTGCTFVKSAGNRGQDIYENGVLTERRDYLVTSPGLAMNAITVGSMNANHKISHFSSWLVDDSFLIKPDIVAPGEYLWDIPNIEDTGNNYFGHSGTSFAAPMVVGIIALLMEEFPTLKTNPASVKSLLHLGAETLPSQTNYFDEQAGFGLVNYQNMRNCRLNSNYANFIISYTAKKDAKVLTRNVTIPYGDEIFINVNSTINSIVDDEDDTQITPNYTEYTINLIDTVTSVVVASSTVDSNVDFLTYKNTNPNNTSFRIEIVLDEDNTSHEGELASMAYEIK